AMAAQRFEHGLLRVLAQADLLGGHAVQLLEGHAIGHAVAALLRLPVVPQLAHEVSDRDVEPRAEGCAAAAVELADVAALDHVAEAHLLAVLGRRVPRVTDRAHDRDHGSLVPADQLAERGARGRAVALRAHHHGPRRAPAFAERARGLARGELEPLAPWLV